MLHPLTTCTLLCSAINMDSFSWQMMVFLTIVFGIFHLKCISWIQCPLTPCVLSFSSEGSNYNRNTTIAGAEAFITPATTNSSSYSKLIRLSVGIMKSNQYWLAAKTIHCLSCMAISTVIWVSIRTETIRCCTISLVYLFRLVAAAISFADLGFRIIIPRKATVVWQTDNIVSLHGFLKYLSKYFMLVFVLNP